MTHSRHSWWRSPLLLALLAVPIVVMLASAYRRQPGSGTIAVQPDQQFQTIHGWEAVAQGALNWLDAHENRQAVTDEMLDKAADLGLTRLRLEARSSLENTRDIVGEFLAGRVSRDEMRCGRYATVNDNDDPRATRAEGFIWTSFDREVRETVLPLARRLESRGERLSVNVTYVAFTDQICRGYEYHHDQPEEYAEFVVTVFQRLRDVHGIVPDSWELMLEPDNTQTWSGQRLADAAVATAQRLQDAGFTPAFVGPATTDAANSLRYFEPIWQKTALRPFLKEMSYHRYSGASRETIAAIGQLSRDRGVATAMLEHMGAGVDTLYEDLTLGNVSAWQQFALSDPGGDTGAHYFMLDPSRPEGERATLSSSGWYLRQYFRALRPGARRIGATSDEEAFKPVAAMGPGDGMAVVVRADRGGRLTVTGLTPGTYSASCWTDRARWERDTDPCDGDVIVDGSGVGVATMPDAGVFSLTRVANAAQ